MDRRRGGRKSRSVAAIARQPDYRQLRHPFSQQSVFSDETIAAIHDKALRVLEELGMKILHSEARELLQSAGALVDSDTHMVRIGRDIVQAALTTAPKSFQMRGANPARYQQYEPGAMLFAAGAGCPNATDLTRGRRPGSLRDLEEITKLVQSFDVLHMFGPNVEPQDVPSNLRHYAKLKTQLAYGDKLMFVYARGRAQAMESFELIRLALDLSDADFDSAVWASTVINTNSPRQIDIPMAEGIIDFARANQLSIITPFCLAGAMAPVSIAGALVLQHAEALAAITLAQVTRAGAPVSYGGFGSNVDMKSGSPAFGTPSHMQMTIGSGQLARHIGLPWRSAAGSASNANDMQAAGENHMGLWAAMMGHATLTVHAAGWLEGGLTFGYEKFINDVEALQTLAELCPQLPQDDDSLAWDAISDVQPGGHFFDTAHTMSRFSTAFYAPLVADLRNHGTWEESGAVHSAERATKIWQQRLAQYTPPPTAADACDRIAAYIESHTKAGGAAPVGG